MTAQERFDLAARAAFLFEQLQTLRNDIHRHYRRPGTEGFHVASAAWWALSAAEQSMSKALAELVDEENPIPADEEAA